ncbi:signal-regulatory protein beta-2-like [Centropristis striata]|uniref:signal-regulatory protein beta-2-like n=1 Tax=Centropristis striata TaxID=184440 RepID=UPI0027E0DBC5|nr:signal-regulatory protein beta-2-like [Centropristis striata]
MLIVIYTALMFTIGRCSDDQNIVTKTVIVGEDVTLTCNRNSALSGNLFWIRVVAGNFPDILGKTYTFDNGLVVSTTPRITAKKEPGTFVLHITKTELSDAAFYYCELLVELQTTFLNKTILKVKEPEPDITAVTQDFLSDPVRPGDSVTLQCSVFSDSEHRTCPGGHSVFWFRARSDETHPRVIYAHGNSDEKCERSPDAGFPQKCIYNFSKSVSSSDAGTYYCAVATCGEILLGNGTKLDIEGTGMGSFGVLQEDNVFLVLLSVLLAISVIVIAILTYAIKKNKCDHCNDKASVSLQETVAKRNLKRDEDAWMYSAVVFTMMKTGSGGKRDAKARSERERIYAAVKAFGLD